MVNLFRELLTDRLALVLLTLVLRDVQEDKETGVLQHLCGRHGFACDLSFTLDFLCTRSRVWWTSTLQGVKMR